MRFPWCSWLLPLAALACGGSDDETTTVKANPGGAAGKNQAGASPGAGGSLAAGASGAAAGGSAAGSPAAGAGGSAGGAGGNTAGGSGAGAGGSAAGGPGAGGSAAGGAPAAGAGGAPAAGAAGAGAAAGQNASGNGGEAGGIFGVPQVPRTFTYRIATPYTPSETSSYDVIGLDLFDNTKETIAALKAKGKAVICYFSSTYEDWRPDFSGLSGAEQAALDDLLAGPLDGWPGEQWLDIHGFSASSPGQAHALLRSIMIGRIQQAKDKGCDAVDFDNVNEHENGVQNKNGEAITSLDQYAYNAWLAEQAHGASLKAFLKNDLTQIADDGAYPGGEGLARVFDGAINEQCFEYDECDQMIPFRDLGKPIFVIQYQYGVPFPSASHKSQASELHLNVSYYAKSPETALQSDPSETFGAW